MIVKRGLLAAVLALTLISHQDRTLLAAEDPLKGDLRDLSVGMTVDQLPVERYVNFACGQAGDEPELAIEDWTGFSTCPQSEDGLHEVAFDYAEDNPWAAVSDKWEGTKVAGHPVQPSLLITEEGVVQGIRIVTNGQRLYLKKKAYLLPIRIMGRYGRDGWSCEEAEPGNGKTAIGGMFIDRLCKKTFHDRHLVMKVDLYRTADQEGREFTGATRFEIFKRDAG